MKLSTSPRQSETGEQIRGKNQLLDLIVERIVEVAQPDREFVISRLPAEILTGSH